MVRNFVVQLTTTVLVTAFVYLRESLACVRTIYSVELLRLINQIKCSTNYMHCLTILTTKGRQLNWQFRAIRCSATNQ